MLKIFSQVKKLKEKQKKSEDRDPCTKAFTKVWGLPSAYIIARRCFEDVAISLSHIDQHWQFYKPRSTRSDGLDAGWVDWPKDRPRRRHFHYVSRERTPSLEPMSLSKKVENQRLTNIDCKSTTPPLEMDSNHDLMVNFFQPGSAIPRQDQLVTSRQRQSIKPQQPESITPPEPQLDTLFLPELLHNSSSSANSKNPTCSDNKNENDLVSDCSHLTSFSRLGTPIRSSVIFSESLGLQPAVDPIVELQFSAKIKPKRRPSGPKNKKRSIAQVDLERSTRRDPSRFEHEAKVRKTGTKNQDNINAKGRKEGDQGNGSCQKKVKTQAKRNKISTDSLSLDRKEKGVQGVAMSTIATKGS